MTNIVEKFNEKQIQISKSVKEIPDFKSGDVIKVSYKIIDGDSSRTQVFEGVVIAKQKQKSDFNSTVTVRKISHGVGVERKYFLHSPLVEDIKIVRKGVVRRGKLYYLRNLEGKSARIKGKIENNSNN